MPTQSEIDRMIVLLYRSNNAHDYTNFVRPAGWLDKLPMRGLYELEVMLERMRDDVSKEIEQRKTDGIPVYSREYHEQDVQEREVGVAALNSIGIKTDL